MPASDLELPETLDPPDWDELRLLAHRMLDEALDEMASVGDGPVWRKMPPAVRSAWTDGMPREPTPIADVYEDYRRLIAPYAVGNRHGGFFGWVHGGGTPVGMLADMLASGLNANLGGRDQAPILCERQVIRWAAEMLGLPSESSGLLVTGTSMANFMAVLVARTAALGADSRRAGIDDTNLVGYASASVHGCVGRAFDMAGLGSKALRLVPCDATGRLNLELLRAMHEGDRAAGLRPFLAVGTGGSVDTGAVDNLSALADFCQEHGLWFHVDAAFGAIAMLSERYRTLFRGIERAHSVAFDFHKWAQVPYDSGCLVVSDADAHAAAFAQSASYLARGTRGLAAGSPWPCDLGPDLSRGFRALKVWMSLKTYGAGRIGRVVEESCRLAHYLADRIEAHPALELAAPVALNIVCFRCVGLDDRAHAELAADIQESGVAAPSTTRLNGRTVLRAAIVNHRTRKRDIDRLLAAALAGAEQYREAATALADAL